MLRHLLGVELTLELELADGLVPAFADRAQVEQVVVNLVINARDAHEGRPGTIVVATSDRSPQDLSHALSGSFSWLQVIDRGSASPKGQATDFDPFFSTKDPDQGTGLGLATIYEIVTQTGGGSSSTPRSASEQP